MDFNPEKTSLATPVAHTLRFQIKGGRENYVLIYATQRLTSCHNTLYAYLAQTLRRSFVTMVAPR